MFINISPNFVATSSFTHVINRVNYLEELLVHRFSYTFRPLREANVNNAYIGIIQITKLFVLGYHKS